MPMRNGTNRRPRALRFLWHVCLDPAAGIFAPDSILDRHGCVLGANVRNHNCVHGRCATFKAPRSIVRWPLSLLVITRNYSYAASKS